MRILIDIGHPAHVHYFRNFIKIMESKGHEFIITARNKEVVFDLLAFYKINFRSRGKGGFGLFKKLLYILKADFLIYRIAKVFKPDLYLSFGSPYAAHVAFLNNKPHIAFDDTDNAPFEHLLYVPFTDTIITPISYKKNYGKKHIRINSYMELCSTHSDFFNPDNSIMKELEINSHQKFALLRLVSWNASHDIGLKGLSYAGLKKIIQLLKIKYKIIISSEKELPEEFKEYAFKIHPSKIHNTLCFADIFIGESLTMAVESAILGTPAFIITTAKAGVTNEQVENGLVKKFENENELIIEIQNHIDNSNSKNDFLKKSKSILVDKINVTKFMIWFVENYPKSKMQMQINPNFQKIFI
jgi:predicted glycosyltransferase